MKSHLAIALFVCFFAGAHSGGTFDLEYFEGDYVDPDEGFTLPPDVLEPPKESILCRNGRYIDGVLQTDAERELVNCTGTKSVRPACQTKVEQRMVNGESKTVTWKHCKTEKACERNADKFNMRDCHKPIGSKGFRICVSCCDGDDCNEDMFIEEVASFSASEWEEYLMANRKNIDDGMMTMDDLYPEGGDI